MNTISNVHVTEATHRGVIQGQVAELLGESQEKCVEDTHQQPFMKTAKDSNLKKM